MSIKEHKFEINGHKLTFSILSGMVLDTDQRSDTHVTGSGSVFVYKGIGTGQSKVNSTVEVNRDIWIKDDEDKEHHLRFNFDLPIRKDQRLSKISLSGSNLSTEIIEMSIYNHNTQDWSWTQGNKILAKPEPKYSFLRVFTKWFIRVFLAAFILRVADSIFHLGIVGGSFRLNEVILGSIQFGLVIAIPIGLFVWLFHGITNDPMDKKIRNEHNKLIKLCVDANF